MYTHTDTHTLFFKFGANFRPAEHHVFEPEATAWKILAVTQKTYTTTTTWRLPSPLGPDKNFSSRAGGRAARLKANGLKKRVAGLCGALQGAGCAFLFLSFFVLNELLPA